MVRPLAAAAFAAAVICAAAQTPAHGQVAPSAGFYGRLPSYSGGNRLTLDRSNAGDLRFDLFNSAPGGGQARAGRAGPGMTVRELGKLLAAKAARLHVSARMSPSEQAAGRDAMIAALRLLLNMQANGALPLGAARAFAAHGTMSVSHDVSGWNRRKDNFNMNIRDLEQHLRNDATYDGVSTVEIAADIVHDGWHVVQNQERRSPVYLGFRSDPGACGENSRRVERYDQIVIANEREANAGEVEFYKAVPGLPDYVRDHLIQSIQSLSDDDLMRRYRDRRRTDGAATPWRRKC